MKKLLIGLLIISLILLGGLVFLKVDCEKKISFVSADELNRGPEFIYHVTGQYKVFGFPNADFGTKREAVKACIEQKLSLSKTANH